MSDESLLKWLSTNTTDSGPPLTREKFLADMEKVFNAPEPAPMRYAMGFDEAKWMILRGQADRVLVSPRTLERLKSDPELAELDAKQRRGAS